MADFNTSSVAGPTANYPTGAPIPGAQVAQGSQNLQQSAMEAATNPAVATDNTQLQPIAQDALTNLQTIQSPTNRQAQVDQTQAPQMQSNYDDLAKKLAGYDQAVLQPQFQGTNPGTPADAPSFGRVDASSLTQLTPDFAALSADQGGKYNANPTYAMTGQISQGNSIIDLLNLLNKSIGEQNSLSSNKYKSSVDQSMNALTIIKDLMNTNTQAQTQKALEGMRIAQANKQMLQDKQLKLIELGYVDPATGQPWAGTGTSADGTQSLKTPQDFADSFMGGYTKWGDIPDSMKVAVTNLVKKEGGNVKTIIDGYTSLNNSMSVLNDLADKWTKQSGLERMLPPQLVQLAPGLAPTRAAIESEYTTSILPELRKSVLGGRMTQQEMQWIHDAIVPKPTDTFESEQAKLQAVKYGLQMKMQNPSYQLGDNTLSEATSAAKSTPAAPNMGGNTPASSATLKGGTTKIQGGDGRIWNIPTSQVQAAIQRGGKVVQ